ncbi:unannotated protein [freshwater metagenome]|uniref:Unannotated protein n=1 Tax=freshwater metagenome TaxID=449393 RepID=A0A6J7EUZ2_9ZZZZ
MIFEELVAIATGVERDREYHRHREGAGGEPHGDAARDRRTIGRHQGDDNRAEYRQNPQDGQPGQCHRTTTISTTRTAPANIANA